MGFTAAAFLAHEAGRWTKRLQRFWHAAGWKTPNFTGNSGRSPIYPYIAMPFYEDHEEIRDYWRQQIKLEAELLT